MARIHFLGTCSGTEPMPNMHHTSFLLECGGAFYWFDAGEGCAHTAHTTGLDVLKTRAVFISHPHIDHTGGLANLLSCMRKLIVREKRSLPNDNSLDIFLECPEVLNAVKVIVLEGQADGNLRFTMREHGISDGTIFEDENIRVSALHNRHLGEDGSNGWHSFSFFIEADGRKIVYSGDLKNITECDELIAGGCDAFIMETGHHAVRDVCEYAVSKGVGALYFNHHGREILGNRAAAEALTLEYSQSSGIPIKIAYDTMCVAVRKSNS